MQFSPGVLAFLAVVFPIATASPIQPGGYGTLPFSCEAALNTLLPPSIDQSSFCSSYISLHPTTTTHISISQDFTITLFSSFTPTTVATQTLTFCDGRPSIAKRSAVPPAYTTPPSYQAPPYQQNHTSTTTSLDRTALLSSACSCLNLPAATYTETDITAANFVDYFPTFTSSVTVYETHVGASKVSLAPTYLSSPTPLVFTNFNNYAEIEDMPFPIYFRNISSDGVSVYASINGVISINNNGGNADAHNLPFPAFGIQSDGFIAQDAFAVLWSGYSINSDVTNPQSGLTQRIQYAVEGTAPCRTLTLEWVVGSDAENSTQHYRFWATFFEDKPETFRYTYWDVSDDGRSGTVGAQALRYDFENQEGPGEWAAYAYDGEFGVDIPSGLVLDYDYESNSFIASTIYEGMC